MSNDTTSPTLFGRIGGMFRRGNRITELAAEQTPSILDEPSTALAAPLAVEQVEPRTTFLRPWTKREQAIEQLQSGVTALSDLMGSIRDNLERQSAQQGKLADVLERIHGADVEHRRALDALQERVTTIGMTEEAVGRSLATVGAALESVGRTSESSAQVIAQLRDNLSGRDTELERVIRKQNTRFTVMLSVAIVTSVAALTAVVILGYFGYAALSHLAH